MDIDEIYLLYSLAAVEFSEQDKAWMPQWLTEHPGIKSYPKPQVFKVFSKYGLNDFREKIENQEAVSNFAKFLKHQLDIGISAAYSKRAAIPEEQDMPYKDLVDIAKKFNAELSNPATWQGDKHRLTIQIRSGNLRIDAGTSIVKAYNIIRSHFISLNLHTLVNLDNEAEFKEYNKRGKYELVFSTKASDIAAMASRSDWESCQTLSVEKGLNGCVIGSTLSKFVGICYFTTGSDIDGRGEKMIFRCLIRFAINIDKKQPTLLLDSMYPSYSGFVAKTIIDAISNRASIPVIDLNKGGTADLLQFKVPEEKLHINKDTESTWVDQKNYFAKENDSHKNEEQNRRIVNLLPFAQLLIQETTLKIMSKFNHFINIQHGTDNNILHSSYYYSEESLELCRKVFVSMFIPIGKALAAHYKNKKTGLMEQLLKKYIKTKIYGTDAQKAGLAYINQFIQEFIGDRQNRNQDLAKMIDKYGSLRFLADVTEWIDNSI